MKKSLFVIIVLGILIVSGCKAPETEEKAGVTVTPKEPTVREVSTGKEEVVKGPELSQELKTLFAKADTVESLQYFYHEAEEGAEYYVIVGKNMRITFPSRRHIGGTTWYTDIYIDLVKKTAKGYCEVESCREETDMPGDIDLNLLYLETPMDVLKSIKYGEKKGDEMISGRRAVIVESPLSSGNTQRTWIWDYKGIPIRYTVVNPDSEVIRRVDYEDMAVNNVKMSEVTK